MGLTKAKDFKGKFIKALIYGLSGVGKTHLGASIPDALHILGESQGLMTIRSVNPEAEVWVLNEDGKATDETMRKELIDALHYLRENKDKYNAVVIDSLTEIYTFVLGQITKKNGRGIPDTDDYVETNGVCINIVKSFRDLDMNVLFICLGDEKMDKEKNLFMRPALSPKFNNMVTGCVNIVGYMYSRLNKEGNVGRKVLFQESQRYQTKPAPGLESVEGPDFMGWTDKIEQALCGNVIPIKKDKPAKKPSKVTEKTEAKEEVKEEAEPKTNSRRRRRS